MLEMSAEYLEDVARRMVHVYIIRPVENQSTEPPTKEETEKYNKEVKERVELQKKLIKYFYTYKGEFSENFIHEIHKIVKGYDPTIAKGVYKNVQNFVAFSNSTQVVVKATPEETPHLMEEWIKKQRHFLKRDLTQDEAIYEIANSMIEFLWIHPYMDGNGNVCRALMLYLGLNKGLLPIVISKEQRFEYAQYVNKKDAKALYNLLKSNLEKENKLLKGE